MSINIDDPDLGRLEALVLFGQWQGITLDEPAPAPEELRQRTALLKQCSKYQHIPGMLAKLDKFAAHADDGTARRIVAVLEALHYQHSANDGPEAYYPYTELTFWGLIEVALLNRGTRQALVAGFFNHQQTLPLLAKQIEILERFVAAMRDPALTSMFTALRDQALAALPPRVETATEAAVREVMETLGIAQPEGHWRIHFTVATVQIDSLFYKRNALKGEDLRLDVELGEEGRWSVKLHRHDDAYFVHWDHRQHASVRAELLRYRKLVKWPALESLQHVADLVDAIEQVLGVRFIRHADVASNFGTSSEELAERHGAAIATWLFGSTGTLGTGMRPPAAARPWPHPAG